MAPAHLHGASLSASCHENWIPIYIIYRWAPAERRYVFRLGERWANSAGARGHSLEFWWAGKVDRRLAESAPSQSLFVPSNHVLRSWAILIYGLCEGSSE